MGVLENGGANFLDTAEMAAETLSGPNDIDIE